ncbi:MAG: cobalamin-dependent protein [Planctomycetota bacterium]
MPSINAQRTENDPPPAALFAADMLRAGTRVYASKAATLLLEEHPESAALFGNKAFRGWHDHLTQRVGELAASLSVGSPDRFRRDVLWSVAAFAAREVPTEAVADSLRLLRRVMDEELPPEAAAQAGAFLDAAIDAAQGPARPLQRLSIEGPLGDLPLRYLEIVLEGRRREAIDLLEAAANDGVAVADLYEYVLLAVEAEIGTMWHLGELTVPEEHVATETARSAMAVLCHAQPPTERHDLTVLVGAIEGDRHDIGLRAVSDLIEIAGYRAISLGADVPVRDLVRAVEFFDAEVIILSATMTVHLPAVRDAIRAIRDGIGERSMRIFVGGEAFSHEPGLAQRLGADGYAATPRDAVAML